MTYSRIEKRDLLKAWGAVSLAFGILLGGGINSGLPLSLLIASITAGIGFLGHELAHKYVAQRYGCWAEFRSQDSMLIIMIAMSFFGFIFAAPGAVMIQGHVGRARTGRIAAAGPLASLMMGLGFLGLLAFSHGVFAYAALYGFIINSWLGLFNLIPLGPFDGKKILEWNKPRYYALVAVGVILFLISLWLI